MLFEYTITLNGLNYCVIVIYDCDENQANELTFERERSDKLRSIKFGRQWVPWKP